MAKTLKHPPFPPLTRDGADWRGAVALPWYATAEPPQLIVRPEEAAAEGADAAWTPTEAQAAALRFLLDPATPLRPALLARFRENVPELAEADWAGVEAFFELAAVYLFHPAADDVAYTGLELTGLQWEHGYEHGVGIIAHRDRVVQFGFAEEAADLSLVQKDLRRLARAPRGGKRPPDGGTS